MPTIFSHAVFASAIGAAVRPTNLSTRFWILTSLCAILPDFDVVAFVFRVSYGSMFGHRGITHSILFAVVVGAIVARLFFSRADVRWWKLALYFAAVTLSHPMLDMFTNGGLGVALLAPFSNERYFSPWRPIEVSPIGMRFFGERGIAVIASELLWIWVPSIVIVTVDWLARRRASVRQSA